MCGFYFSTRDHFDPSVNVALLTRGPDGYNDLTVNGCRLVHSHLSIFESDHNQPYLHQNNEIALVFNGEIYENLNGLNESEYLVEKYIVEGEKAFEDLLGEYAICLVDFKANKLFLITDPFGTKPLFVSICGGIHVSTYPSAISNSGTPRGTITPVEPNTIRCYSLKNFQLLGQKELVAWGLRQHIVTWDSWQQAFSDSVEVRSRHMKTGEVPFIGISSGHDSGGIHLAHLQLGLPFVGISVEGKEDLDILRARQNLSHQAGMEHVLIDHQTARQLTDEIAEMLRRRSENLPYNILSSRHDISGEAGSVLEDKASIALGLVNLFALEKGARVSLSGNGADELMSDYSSNGEPIYQHSNFCGVWPENLETIFPWPSFYGSTQRAYLMKDECVGGAFGIESRYPYLDKRVVQSFLSLTIELKNRSYKAPLSAFLSESDYPHVNRKIGLSPWT